MTAMPLASATPALPAVRQRYALELLRRFGVVRCHELEFRFGISEATARRDIDAVVRRGYGERVYGGAVLADSPVFGRSHPRSQAEASAPRGHASVMP